MVIFVWLAASWLPGFELFSDRTLKSNHFHFPQFVVRHYRKTNHIMAYFAVNIYTYVCTSVHSNLRTFLTISLSLSLFSSPCPRGVFRDLFVCVYNWNYYLFFNRTELKKKMLLGLLGQLKLQRNTFLHSSSTSSWSAS